MYSYCGINILNTSAKRLFTALHRCIRQLHGFAKSSLPSATRPSTSWCSCTTVWWPLLDQHCAIVTVRHRANKKTTSCLTPTVVQLVVVQGHWAAERRFKRTSSDADYCAWSVELSKTRSCTKRRTRYSSAARLLHPMTTQNDCGISVLGEPANDDTGAHTADDFAAFFKDNVDSVRASTTTTPPYDVPSRSTPTLENWTPVTTDELEKLIGSAPCKTC